MDRDKKKSKYNMSMLIMGHLARMLINASNYYRNGQIDSWFFEWKNIKFQIISELDKKERASLADKEKAIAELLIKNKHIDATPKIEEYLTEIQDYIKDKEIGLVEKSDETIFA